MGAGWPVIVTSCHRVPSGGFQCTLELLSTPHAFRLITRGLEEAPSLPVGDEVKVTQTGNDGHSSAIILGTQLRKPTVYNNVKDRCRVRNIDRLRLRSTGETHSRMVNKIKSIEVQILIVHCI
jgi:hypothetical protein